MDLLNQNQRSSLSLSADLSSSPRISFQRDKAIQSIEYDLDYDDDHEASLSGSARHSSGPDEMVFDDNLDITRQSSPRTSHHSDDDISELPSDWRGASCVSEQRPLSPHTPIKTRSPFRNPSSVRAMQLETTPPPYLTRRPSQQQQQHHKSGASSRNHTPRSVRSHHSLMRSPSKLGPSKKIKKEYPLVLLHVTMLPIVPQYSQELMESVLPGYIMENWKLLGERVTDTVLERGILIPHPREDYDLLEERLLESLELKVPRILKCGHFHLGPDEEKNIVDTEEDEEYDSNNDLDICDDCGKRIRDGRHGSGTGLRRWDIKIFAANGLMRAGAWGAAWNEMERVDVEIHPWIENDLRRELELRKEEEEEQRRLLTNHQSIPSPARDSRGDDGCSRMDEARMREIYGEEAQAYLDGLARRGDEHENEQNVPKHFPSSSQQSPHHANPNSSSSPKEQHRRRPQPQHQNQVPLWTILRNYIYLASQDRRNIAILFLSALVLFLSFSPFPSPRGVAPSRRLQEQPTFYAQEQQQQQLHHHRMQSAPPFPTGNDERVAIGTEGYGVPSIAAARCPSSLSLPSSLPTLSQAIHAPSENTATRAAPTPLAPPSPPDIDPGCVGVPHQQGHEDIVNDAPDPNSNPSILELATGGEMEGE